MAPDPEFREAMTETDRQSHWQRVYLSKGEREVSWSQREPQPSLGLIEKFSTGAGASVAIAAEKSSPTIEIAPASPRRTIAWAWPNRALGPRAWPKEYRHEHRSGPHCVNGDRRN